MITVTGCMTLFLFFFQAEDGIRDVAVTGVQTCALPIWEEKAGRDASERAGLVDARHRLAKGLVRCSRGGDEPIELGVAIELPPLSRDVRSRLAVRLRFEVSRLLTSRESGGSSMATPRSED